MSKATTFSAACSMLSYLLLRALHRSRYGMLHGQSLENFKFQLTVREAERSFHLGWRFPAREEEPEIRRPLGPCRNQIMQARRDLHIFDPGRAAGILFAFYFFKDAGLGHGNHHHAGRAVFPIKVRSLLAQRVP